MRKLKKIKLHNMQQLSTKEMMLTIGGRSTHTCNVGASCKLYVEVLQHTIEGTCKEMFNGTIHKCYCQNGAYQTNQTSTPSMCWS